MRRFPGVSQVSSRTVVMTPLHLAFYNVGYSALAKKALPSIIHEHAAASADELKALPFDPDEGLRAEDMHKHDLPSLTLESFVKLVECTKSRSALQALRSLYLADASTQHTTSAGKSVSPTMRAYLCGRRDAGDTWDMISESTGIPKSTVRLIYKTHQVKFQSAPQIRNLYGSLEHSSEKWKRLVLIPPRKILSCYTMDYLPEIHYGPVKEWFQSQGYTVMDLIPIEHVWVRLKENLHKYYFELSGDVETLKSKLADAIIHCWELFDRLARNRRGH
ncbi:hypothetical protein BGX38DRAFT_1171740 [Terfezia claveryi]|nr:hypothetical protein BGX38DRAFT_1171740 [Terfezia claveryi]